MKSNLFQEEMHEKLTEIKVVNYSWKILKILGLNLMNLTKIQFLGNFQTLFPLLSVIN